MKNLKEIHCFGTSFTQGGGFEFDAKIKTEKLLKHYKEKPLTQSNYSWPGQLQKIIGNNINIINHAKNGYGNERMYRCAYNVITKSETLDDKLFIFEFSGLQRKEVWSNTYNTHLITNYRFEDDESVTIMGIADTYWYENQLAIENKLKPIIQPYLDETLNFEIEDSLVIMHMNFFIDYLIENDVNFKIVQQPYGYINYEKLLPYMIQFPSKKPADIIGFAMESNLTIIDETNGDIQDGHGGFRWAKIVANTVADNLRLNINKINSII
jgi:hypothetical protein